jgi:hypothetical protein
MEVRVFSHSATGNTAKVARAIADAAGCAAERADPAVAPQGGADLLFLGGAVYATRDHGLDPALIGFLSGLDPRRVKRAALFATGFPTSDAVARMRALLSARGIRVEDDGYFCKGRFLLFNVGHPGKDDLEAAAVFARRIMGA